MFSFLLKNEYLGSILAPEEPLATPPFEQIKSLVKAGKSEEALEHLTRSGPLSNIDAIDRLSDRDGLNVLHVASAANALSLVVELINVRGAKVNVMSSNGNTPLHYSAANGHANLIDILLRYGADPSIPNHNGEIAYDLCKDKSSWSASLLLQNRAELEDKLLSPTALYHKRSLELGASPASRGGGGGGGVGSRPMARGGSSYSSIPLSSSSSSSSSSPLPPSLSESIVAVASETAQAMSEDLSYRVYCNHVFSWVADPESHAQSVERLRGLFSRDPSLASCRTAGIGKVFNDGFTPLHAAAQRGRCDVINLLFEFPHVNSWVRDLQGKTPLHVAAERRHVAACTLLRDKMKHESGGLDPVGDDAPLDLSGRTPLGCYCKGLEDDNVAVSAEMRDALFKPGDRSVLPCSPVPERSGCSPWRSKQQSSVAATSATLADSQFVYAFSEACGFKRQMEDQVVLLCPLEESLLPSWSLFGVCDGHGGSACSKYLSQRFGSVLLEETRLLVKEHLQQDQPGLLEQLLLQACAIAELEMRNSSVFRCEVLKRDEASGQPTRIAATNTSGSTGVFCLATVGHLAVANVGDSRAVLAQFPAKTVLREDAPSGQGGMLSPRPEELISSEASAMAAVTGGDHAGIAVPHGLKAVALSEDQKMSDPAEQARARNAGASIVDEGSGSERITVSGAKICRGHELIRNDFPRLAVARAFGDFVFKYNDRVGVSEQAVIAVPEIKVHVRSASDAFVVLASDGVFDFMSSQEVVDFLGTKLGYTINGAPPAGITVEDLAEACDKLIYHALDKGSEIKRPDNLCVVVVVLDSADSSPIAASAATPTQTPRQPVLTPSSGTADSTPVAQTLSRVFEASTLDTSTETAVEEVSRVLTFT